MRSPAPSRMPTVGLRRAPRRRAGLIARPRAREATGADRRPGCRYRALLRRCRPAARGRVERRRPSSSSPRAAELARAFDAADQQLAARVGDTASAITRAPPTSPTSSTRPSSASSPARTRRRPSSTPAPRRSPGRSARPTQRLAQAADGDRAARARPCRRGRAPARGQRRRRSARSSTSRSPTARTG